LLKRFAGAMLPNRFAESKGHGKHERAIRPGNSTWQTPHFNLLKFSHIKNFLQDEKFLIEMERLPNRKESPPFEQN
jgi:hypothetical protein